MRNIMILLTFYLAFVSCSSNTADKEVIKNKKDTSITVFVKDDKITHEEAKVIPNTKQLNSKQVFEKAIDLQRKNGFFLSTPKDTQVFINSAILMEKAITLDSSNQNIYMNLAKVYFKLDSVSKAIQVLDKLLKVDSNYVEAITSQGFIYEKMGEQEKAMNSYKKALNIYSFRLIKNYGDRINKSFLVMLLYGENPALEELEEVKKLYPEKDVSFFENQFRNFDREIFIKNSLR